MRYSLYITKKSSENIIPFIENLLLDIQKNIYNKALTFRDNNIHKVNNWQDFLLTIEEKGGFISAFWDGTPETEEKIKEATKATIRCIPLTASEEKGKCVYSGKPSDKRVIFARAY